MLLFKAVLHSKYYILVTRQVVVIRTTYIYIRLNDVFTYVTYLYIFCIFAKPIIKNVK